MKKLITESELKARVNRLKEYMAVVESNQVDEAWYDPRTWFGGKEQPAAAPAAPAQGAKPVAPAGAPKVAYDKTMPAATVQELQTKLNAKDPTLKLKVDGKLGQATKAAMAKYPDVTTNPNAPQNQAAAANPGTPEAGVAFNQAAKAAAPAAPTAASIIANSPVVQASQTTPAAPVAADPNAPRDEQGVNIANKPGAGVNAQGQNVTMPGGINPETGEPTVTTAGATPNYKASVAFNQAAKAAAPAAADWESSPVASTALTPQQKALAQKSGFATNNQQAGALAAKNLAAAQSGQPISANESVGYQNDELNRIISLVHHR